VILGIGLVRGAGVTALLVAGVVYSSSVLRLSGVGTEEAGSLMLGITTEGVFLGGLPRGRLTGRGDSCDGGWAAPVDRLVRGAMTRKLAKIQILTVYAI
jgi:hypothetical protein